jgi:DNA repair exonuclease SbcCD ATPase subunit
MKEIEQLQRNIQEQDRRISDKRSNLENELSESDEQLHQTLASFEEIMRVKERDLQLLRQQLDAINREIQVLRSRSNDLNLQKGQAIALQNQITALKDKQLQLSGGYKKKYNFLPMVPAKWNANVVKDAINMIYSEVCCSFDLPIFVSFVIPIF